MHGQVVVCPGVNDGAALEDTLAGILDRYPALASVGAVPLGLSRYSNEPEMRPHTPEEAARVLDTIEEWQGLFTQGARPPHGLRRRRVLPAGRARPSLGPALRRLSPARERHRHGPGLRRVLRAARGGRARAACATGSSPRSTPRRPRATGRPRLPTAPAGADDRPVTVLTGTYGARVLAPARGAHPRHDVDAARRGQRLLRRQHRGGGPAHRRGPGAGPGGVPDGSRCLLPDACLNEGRFLDGLTLADLPRPVEVVPTEGGSLRRALDGTSFRPGVRVMSPMVVVAGRPNVGKSSLVNRIVGARAAVVEEEQGVTRDRKVLTAEWAGVPFSIMDTGGWLAGGDALEAKVSEQAERALAEADVVLMVVDVTTGVTEEDLAAAKVIRRAGPPVRLVVNKVDDANREAAAWEFVSLGLGDPFPVSALHGRGTGDLLDEVVALLPVPLPEDDEDGAVAPAADDGARGDRDPGTPRVAIIGRPNVGKSTLFNRLLGEERSIVHDMPGTTRDAIDTVVETPDGPVCFIDTAGLRRPSKTDRGTEQHATLRALRALERADIAVLVIDATVGASHQDQRLAERIGVSGCPAIVVLNKWDLVPADDRDDVLAGVGDRLAFLGAAPVLKMSALSGKGVHRILPALRDCRRRPTTSGCRPGPSTAPCRSCRLASRRPGQDPLHRPGRHRPPDLHALHQRAAAPDLPPLHRARHPREVRPRRHADEAAGADRREVRSGRS